MESYHNNKKVTKTGLKGKGPSAVTEARNVLFTDHGIWNCHMGYNLEVIHGREHLHPFLDVFCFIIFKINKYD